MTDRTDQTSRFPQTSQSPEHIVLQRSETATGDLITIQAAGRGMSKTLEFRAVPSTLQHSAPLFIPYTEEAVFGSMSETI